MLNLLQCIMRHLLSMMCLIVKQVWVILAQLPLTLLAITLTSTCKCSTQIHIKMTFFHMKDQWKWMKVPVYYMP